MALDQRKVIDAFNRDVAENAGYRYTTNASLSSLLANRRLTDLALSSARFRGQKILDIGCGDGSYTFDLYDEGRPAAMHAIDPAEKAIQTAKLNAGSRDITFTCHDAEALPFPGASFDIAHLRGVLHHMLDPAAAVAEALRVAATVIIIEPNGYNPVLKVLERVSRYHREHGEHSFTHATIDRWIAAGAGRVQSRQWAGLVPFFCPDWLARILKAIEPAFERIPGLNLCSCAVYVVVASRVAA
jgi:ubiquinone/menaquinone biosynthesis C-methylase UbiE